MQETNHFALIVLWQHWFSASFGFRLDDAGRDAE